MTPLPVLADRACETNNCCSTACRQGAADNDLPTGQSLIDHYIAEQQSLSAVEQFSRWHDTSLVAAKNYRSLMPTQLPAAGEQYAFTVDLDRCSGCKACVVACHTLNGLDEGEIWRDVGLLVGGSSTSPLWQHVTAACHHCLEPACMRACPVNAYEKDPLTGIVKHLDDQCFGCQYCTMACPYDVPKYHAGKGIVRKCDMCSSRLAVGEPPACVQACPHEAIAIQVVSKQQVADDAEAAVFLPAAPDPQLTLPTTTYKSRKVFPRNLLPADYFRVHRDHAHWPLVVMLVLTQLSVGAFIAWLAMEPFLNPSQIAELRPIHAASSLGLGLLAIGASLFHLGRPRYAFRAVLGLGHSWLSREIVAFGLFAALAISWSALVVFQQALASVMPLASSGAWVSWLGWGVATSGALAVFCSTMIYVFTQRECWSPLRVGVRFLLTSALLGVGTFWLSALVALVVWPSPPLTAMLHEHGPLLCQTVVTISAVKLLWELAIFRHLLLRRMTPLRRSAILLTGELANTTLARFGLGIVGGLLMPVLLSGQIAELPVEGSRMGFVATAGVLVTASLAGELLERYLFFASCATPRMPGSIR